MTWVIVQQCKDCGGQGKLYGYNTTPDTNAMSARVLVRWNTMKKIISMTL